MRAWYRYTNVASKLQAVKDQLLIACRWMETAGSTGQDNQFGMDCMAKLAPVPVTLRRPAGSDAEARQDGPARRITLAREAEQASPRWRADGLSRTQRRPLVGLRTRDFRSCRIEYPNAG